FGGRWRADVLVPASDRLYPSGTLTAYATSWGGLNVARVDPDGKVEVYWWSPETNEWRRNSLSDDVAFTSPQPRIEGRLESAVSSQGQFAIFARNDVGD